VPATQLVAPYRGAAYTGNQLMKLLDGSGNPIDLNYAAPAMVAYDPNFTVSSLRANLVLRWEYLPGSTIYFVWTNDKFTYAQTGTMDFQRNVSTLVNDEPDNIFSLKITYWWSP